MVIAEEVIYALRSCFLFPAPYAWDISTEAATVKPWISVMKNPKGDAPHPTAARASLLTKRPTTMESTML